MYKGKVQMYGSLGKRVGKFEFEANDPHQADALGLGYARSIVKMATQGHLTLNDVSSDNHECSCGKHTLLWEILLQYPNNIHQRWYVSIECAESQSLG